MSVLHIVTRVSGELIDVELLCNSSVGIHYRVHGSSELVHEGFISVLVLSCIITCVWTRWMTQDWYCKPHFRPALNTLPGLFKCAAVWGESPRKKVFKLFLHWYKYFIYQSRHNFIKDWVLGMKWCWDHWVMIFLSKCIWSVKRSFI